MQIQINYKIYDYRRKQNMSLRDLAEKTGISKSQISRVENNQMHPTIYVLVLLAIALDTTPAHLYTVSLIRDK